jgi:hypothetical protein
MILLAATAIISGLVAIAMWVGCELGRNWQADDDAERLNEQRTLIAALEGEVRFYKFAVRNRP